MIAIISDTHDNVFAIRKAVEMLLDLKPNKVYHLGDIIAPLTLHDFNGLPMAMIIGNNDGDHEMLKKIIKSKGWDYLGKKKSLTIDGKEFFLTHGTDPLTIERAVKSKKYTYVLHGHTHVLEDRRVGKTRILNPGAFYPTVEDKTFMTLEPKNDTVTVYSVSRGD